MRREWRWALAALVAITVGATFADGYARLASPYYAFVAATVAKWHPWTIDEVVVADDPKSHGAVLRMTAEVFRQRGDLHPAARVVSRVQVGEVVETPVAFWTLVLMWSAATIRQRLVNLAVGVPMFLGLEAITTGSQIVHSMAEASALLAGEGVTLWEWWSRFLETGGGFVLAIAAAFVAIGIANRLRTPRASLSHR